jgi:predicted aldo/keto reductase-like oxidoreductase
MRVDFFGNLLAAKADPKPYTRREIEGRLREFGFDHLDQFMLGAMEAGDPLGHSPAMMEDTIDELFRQRDAGNIRCIGFSCHDPDYAARLARRFPVFDAVMTPYNYANRAAEGDLADVLRETGMAWIAMKTLVWHVYGIPVTALRNLRGTDRDPGFDPDAPVATLAHRFVLANPLVSTVVPAMNSREAAAENAAAADGRGLLPEEDACLRAYAEAMKAADRVPLALAGLLEDNLRVRGYALEYLRHRLKLDIPAVDYEGDGAEGECAAAARRAIDRLRHDERAAGLIPPGL